MGIMAERSGVLVSDRARSYLLPLHRECWMQRAVSVASSGASVQVGGIFRIFQE